MSTVTFLSTGLARGGGETQVVRLAIQFKERGWAVHVVSMLEPKSFTAELAGAGITVDTLGLSRGVPDPRGALRLSRLLRQQHPDVLHAHMIHANLLARATRWLASVPVVICTAHSTYELPTSAKQVSEVSKREWAYRLTDPLCDLTTQVSQAGVERYVHVKAVPANKIRFIPNGVDTHVFSANPQVREKMRTELGIQNQFVWLAVGRFDEAKDYPTMMQAFAKIRCADATLLIAGQGPLQGEVQLLCKELKLDDRVHFLGVRTDVPDVMRAADAYIMSSFYEGLPLVLLEAAATGLPIVATDVGGISELVLHGKTGYLVPAGDSNALAEAAITLMMLPEDERLCMGGAGRSNVELHYSLDHVTDLWESLYLQLIHRIK